jgi:hypothetical protein
MGRPKKKNGTAGADSVKTGVFRKLVRVPIDAEETTRRKIYSADLDTQIDDLLDKQKPTKEKVTALRAEKRKLKADIRSGTSEQEAQVYEVKLFRKGEAIVYLADGDVEVGRRTLEDADYQADVEEKANGAEQPA